jgi:hypothetical protein
MKNLHLIVVGGFALLSAFGCGNPRQRYIVTERSLAIASQPGPVYASPWTRQTPARYGGGTAGPTVLPE